MSQRERKSPITLLRELPSPLISIVFLYDPIGLWPEVVDNKEVLKYLRPTIFKGEDGKDICRIGRHLSMRVVFLFSRMVDGSFAPSNSDVKCMKTTDPEAFVSRAIVHLVSLVGDKEGDGESDGSLLPRASVTNIIRHWTHVSRFNWDRAVPLVNNEWMTLLGIFSLLKTSCRCPEGLMRPTAPFIKDYTPAVFRALQAEFGEKAEDMDPEAGPDNLRAYMRWRTRDCLMSFVGIASHFGVPIRLFGTPGPVAFHVGLWAPTIDALLWSKSLLSKEDLDRERRKNLLEEIIFIIHSLVSTDYKPVDLPRAKQIRSLINQILSKICTVKLDLFSDWCGPCREAVRQLPELNPYISPDRDSDSDGEDAWEDGF